MPEELLGKLDDIVSKWHSLPKGEKNRYKYISELILHKHWPIRYPVGKLKNRVENLIEQQLRYQRNTSLVNPVNPESNPEYLETLSLLLEIKNEFWKVL